MRTYDHEPGTIIAIFGNARLLKHLNGTYELTPGSPEDLAEAQKWIAAYMPEISITNPRPVKYSVPRRPK
jgi:hypothetical protein